MLFSGRKHSCGTATEKKKQEYESETHTHTHRHTHTHTPHTHSRHTRLCTHTRTHLEARHAHIHTCHPREEPLLRVISKGRRPVNRQAFFKFKRGCTRRLLVVVHTFC